MPSAKHFAIVSTVLLALFLFLRPVVGRLGAPATPDTRGSSEMTLPAGATAPARTIPAPPPPPPLPAAAVSHLEEIERLVLAATNAQRKIHGDLPPLAAEETLRATSRGHNADMLARDFFDHVNPDGLAPSDRIAQRHRRLVGLTGENIWMGSGYDTAASEDLARTIVDGWMASPGHRANILKPEYTHLGVGISAVGLEVRATQNFAQIEALTREPLPATVPRGATLEPSLAKRTDVRQFDLFSTARGLKVAGPLDAAGATLDVAPGIYKLRFYFPRGNGRFAIFPGPQIEVE